MGSPPPYAGCCAKAGCTAARAAVAPHTWQVARPSATLDPQVEQYMGTLPAAARAACRFSGRTGRPGGRVPGRDLIRSNFEKDSPRRVQPGRKRGSPPPAFSAVPDKLTKWK